MLIRQEESDYFVKADTLKDPDPFYDKKMNFVIANPPFGQSWGGKDADDGVEQAVKADQALFESTDGREGRFGSILPRQVMLSCSSIYMLRRSWGKWQSCYHFKRFASVLVNDIWGKPNPTVYLRKWFVGGHCRLNGVNFSTILESVSISGFIIRIRVQKRQGKVQFINATNEFVPLRKSLGQKRRELSQDNIKDILQWYHDFAENDRVKIFDSKEFLYKEYLVMQPLQRRGEITEKSLHSVQSVQFFAKLFWWVQVPRITGNGATHSQTG